jgi:hypothetical protein
MVPSGSSFSAVLCKWRDGCYAAKRPAGIVAPQTINVRRSLPSGVRHDGYRSGETAKSGATRRIAEAAAPLPRLESIHLSIAAKVR